MRTLLTIKEKPDRRAVLEKACFATEFRSFPIRDMERPFFRHINDHTPIPFMVRETVCQPQHKVFLLAQIDLQTTGWPNKLSAAARKQLQQEKCKIYPVLERVLRCLGDILGSRSDGAGLAVGLEVLRSIKSGVWEGSGNELLQIEGIGTAKAQKLNEAGIKTIGQLSKLEFYHIERLVSRNPPFGQNTLHHVSGFPILTLKMDILSEVDDQTGPSSSSHSKVGDDIPQVSCMA